MKTFRPARIAEVIREVAAETILFRLQDPRISGVTVTRVEVPSDLQTAKIYVSVMGSDQDAQQCLQGLASSAGFIQRQLAGRLKLRYTPALSFQLDRGIKNSAEVTRLLQQEGLIGTASPGAAELSSANHPDDAVAHAEEEGSEIMAAGDEADRLAREHQP